MMIYFYLTLTYFSPNDIVHETFTKIQIPRGTLQQRPQQQHKYCTSTPNPFHLWLDKWHYYYQPRLFLNLCTKQNNFASSKPTNFYQANHYLRAYYLSTYQLSTMCTINESIANFYLHRLTILQCDNSTNVIFAILFATFLSCSRSAKF